jgi:hypothetical protein
MVDCGASACALPGHFTTPRDHLARKGLRRRRAKVTAAYDAKVAGGTESSSDRFITEMYQELKGQGK